MAKLDISLSPQEVDDYLRTGRTVRVATASAGGTPHVVPLWFAWLDGTMFWNTTRGNVSVRNLAANPRAAATVDDGETYGELRGVLLQGRAERFEEDPRLDGVLEHFSHKYMGGNPVPFRRWSSRTWFRLSPERIASWDFRHIPEARARQALERARAEA